MAALTHLALWALLIESVTGIAIRFAPFHPAMEWSVLLHTVLGALTLVPLAIYLLHHWNDYRRQAISGVVLLGYLATTAIAICALPGSLAHRAVQFLDELPELPRNALEFLCRPLEERSVVVART